MLCLLSFVYDGDGNIRLVVKDIISAFGSPSTDELATDYHTPVGERHLFTDLRLEVPAGLGQGWPDELGTDVSLAEGFLVHFFGRQER
jgi:hypothetical protein